MARRTAWRFEDPVTSVIYYLPVNPNQDNGLTYSRNLSYNVLAGVRKNSANQDTVDAIAFEANEEQQTFSYNGIVYTEDQYDAFQTWLSKSYPFEIYDDLNRGWLVYLQSFVFTRVRSRKHPFKHSYQMQGIILEKLGV
jgi:hypothetical protein